MATVLCSGSPARLPVLRLYPPPGLGNEYYGREGNDDDLIDRITKEGAHEVGHLVGLGHCDNTECIMFRPDTLDELDGKKKMFCPACREKLATYLTPD